MNKPYFLYRHLVLSLLLTIAAGNLFAQLKEDISPEKHYQQAEKLLSRGDCPQALKHINKVIAAKPGSEAYRLRASIHECAGDLNAAVTDLSILVHSHPEDPEYLFSRGVLLYRTGKFRSAIADLRKSIQFPLNETNTVFYKTGVGKSGISGLSTLETMQAEVYNYIGLAFHGLHRYDSAIASFNQAIATGKNAQFFNNRAMAYEQSGGIRQAIADYEQALKLDEHNQVAIYNLITLYGNLQHHKKQKALLARLDTDEKLPEIYIFKGATAYQAGDYHTAVAEYDSAIAVNNKNEEYFLYRGQAYGKLKRYDKAIEDFKTAIALAAGYPNAYFNLANVYFNTNNLDSALLNYNLAILYDPEYANAYMNRGIVYLRKKDRENACENLSKAGKNGLQEAVALYNEECSGQ